MWDIVRAILIAYGIIVVLEYAIKAMFAARSAQPIAMISPEMKRQIEQRLLDQYEDNAVAAIGRGIPKTRGIGFRA